MGEQQQGAAGHGRRGQDHPTFLPTVVCVVVCLFVCFVVVVLFFGGVCDFFFLMLKGSQ